MKWTLSWLLWMMLSMSQTWAAGEVAANPDEANADADAKETVAELIEGDQHYPGLFSFYRDTETGDTTLLLKPEQLNQEFIYFIHIANGVVDAGSFRGAYGPRFVFTIERRFDEVAIVRQNTAFYFDPENAISGAAEANIARAVLAVQPILAEDEETGELLIETDSLFLSESFSQLTPTPNPDADPKTQFTLGGLDKDKSQIVALRSYPQNTDIEVEYAFFNAAPLVPGSDAVTDSRHIAIRAMHSLIEMPKNDYQPRYADARLGSFNQQITDLTSTEVAPYRDVINRWHLVKKDPSAALSEPVKPITYWIENTTPLAWRPMIRSAALEWNKAFEKAGFRNAVEVKIQPDDADWEAGDLRYNVLRWTSSPNPPFGGYGPSFANPRTGQLLGADIMLEFSFLNRSTLARELIQGESVSTTSTLWPSDHHCGVSHVLGLGGAFAELAVKAAGGSAQIEEQLTRDRLYYLILHEIGHTLGMNHNMKATQLLSRDQISDPSVKATGILAGSVMDYPAVNFAETEAEQTLFYTIAPGPYDDWYIEYAYSTALADAPAEAARLAKIAARSSEPQLVFGNDADDMRYPGSGLDPRVNIYDLSSDSIGYAAEHMALMQTTLNKMAVWSPNDGASYQEAVEGAALIIRLWGTSAGVISRWVGGVYVDRSVAGQADATEPFVPVERDQQKRAMAALADHLFAPNAFEVDGALWRHTAPQRRGFSHFGSTEDAKIHSAVLKGQQRVLDHLLHPVVLKRIVDTELYGNQYVLSDVMQDLSAAIFAADMDSTVNGFRRHLQSDYVTRLGAMATGAAKSSYDSSAQAMALYELLALQDRLKKRSAPDTMTRAHTQHLLFMIAQSLEPAAAG